jgi:hypothetical protein
MRQTKKIRIQVAIGPDGGWYACGSSDESEQDSRGSAFEFIPEKSYSGCHLVVVTAEVPLPIPAEVMGSAKIQEKASTI